MLKIAFYKAKGNWIDKTIRFLTRSKYSHCEIIIDDLMYSVDSYEYKVRYKLHTFDLNKWDYLDFPGENKTEIQNIIMKELNKKYDFCGTLGFVIPLFKQKRTKWYCSELCNYAIFRDIIKTSPQDFYNRCILTLTQG